jgi:hypothetical protein
MMPIYDVPSEKWKDFCRAFVRDHSGDAINLEIVSTPRGIFGVVDERIQYPCTALHDIFIDGDGASQPSLTVAVVGEQSRRAHHQIRAVRKVRLEQPEPLSTAGGQLLVEGEDGTSLRLLLSRPVIQGMLDGV